LAERLDRVDAIEWARLAAFLDAEGTIRIGESKYASGRHIYANIQIANTDPRLGLWLTSLFGGGMSWVTPKNPRHKRSFVWGCSSRHAEFIVRRVRPYLIMKGEQADLLLALRETVKLGRNQTLGLTEDEVRRRTDLWNQSRVLNRRGVPDGQ